MFENPWAAFLHVTVRAHFPVGVAQHDVIAGAMGVMAVRALHETLGYAMMRGKRELCFNRLMTAIAKIGLGFPQESRFQPACFLLGAKGYEELRLGSKAGVTLRVGDSGQMRRVTSLAVDGPQLVLGPIEERLIETGLMASQAAVGVFRGGPSEVVNEFHGCRDFVIVALRGSHAFDMFLPRTVT
jgi:hypothetical protein